mmetsp:Transcript_28126/g.71697  ORF Transcript_28126/g.71697 Transcript_28126/m.71697 type:complete len:332 (-) Transcript_28126:426-1421(-)
MERSPSVSMTLLFLLAISHSFKSSANRGCGWYPSFTSFEVDEDDFRLRLLLAPSSSLPSTIASAASEVAPFFAFFASFTPNMSTRHGRSTTSRLCPPPLPLPPPLPPAEVDIDDVEEEEGEEEREMEKIPLRIITLLFCTFSAGFTPIRRLKRVESSSARSKSDCKYRYSVFASFKLTLNPTPLTCSSTLPSHLRGAALSSFAQLTIESILLDTTTFPPRCILQLPPLVCMQRRKGSEPDWPFLLRTVFEPDNMVRCVRVCSGWSGTNSSFIVGGVTLSQLAKLTATVKVKKASSLTTPLNTPILSIRAVVCGRRGGRRGRSEELCIFKYA